MKIMRKIELWKSVISGTGGGKEADRLQKECIDAVLGGIKSPEWEKYMRNLHSNPQQLARLLGKDEAFMNDPNGWGRNILAYVASDTDCGGATTMGGSTDMPTEMKAFLDKGIDPSTDQVEKNNLHPSLIPYIEIASDI